MVLDGGDLSAPLTNTFTLANNVITINPAATNGFSLTINRPTGQITGVFVDPVSHITNDVNSIMLEATNMARGYWIGTGHAGSFILIGN